MILYKDFLYILENEKNFTTIASDVLSWNSHKPLLKLSNMFIYSDDKNIITKLKPKMILEITNQIMNKQRYYNIFGYKLMEEYK
ncbi:MAG TPA: hypothetical protein PLH46_03890 [Caldisericia bacterium]|nr:hypothetical protein [Methanofastidiosum sp.]HQJ56767.1 hypothetical protein [Caldisericia bacterium]